MKFKVLFTMSFFLFYFLLVFKRKNLMRSLQLKEKMTNPTKLEKVQMSYNELNEEEKRVLLKAGTERSVFGEVLESP